MPGSSWTSTSPVFPSGSGTLRKRASATRISVMSLPALTRSVQDRAGGSELDIKRFPRQYGDDFGTGEGVPRGGSGEQVLAGGERNPDPAGGVRDRVDR